MHWPSTGSGARAKGHYTPLPTRDDLPQQGEGRVAFTRTASESVHVGTTLLELNAYHIASASLIMLNALVLGAETDFPNWFGWNYIENAFLLCFTAEVLLRLVSLTPTVFFSWSRNPEILWDMFDMLVVSVGLLDIIITLLCPGRRSMKVAMIFRIIRLLRLLRILRIFRFLKQLYLMAYGFTEAVLAICWVTIFMSFVLYMCGIVLSRVYGHVSPEDKDYLFLVDHFGTVPGSMLTLFELMASPDLAVYEEVMESRPFMRCFLIAFIIFGSFGMIALLTGVISESMFEKNQAKAEEDRADREHKRAQFVRDCSELFCSMEADEHGAIHFDELVKHKDRIRTLVEAAGTHLTESEMHKLLEAMDADASGGVDSIEFETGVLAVCQDIRPMSILEIHHCVRRCHMSVCGLDSRVEEICNKLDGLTGVLELARAADSRLAPARAHAWTSSASAPASLSLQLHSTTSQVRLPSPRPCAPSARSTGRVSARAKTEEEMASSSAPSPASLPLLPSLPASARGTDPVSDCVVEPCGETPFPFLHSQKAGKGEGRSEAAGENEGIRRGWSQHEKAQILCQEDSQWQGQGHNKEEEQEHDLENRQRQGWLRDGNNVLEDFRRQLQAMATLAQAELELVESSQRRLSGLLELRAEVEATAGLGRLDPYRPCQEQEHEPEEKQEVLKSAHGGASLLGREASGALSGDLEDLLSSTSEESHSQGLDPVVPRP